jgi:hypothetical protein
VGGYHQADGGAGGVAGGRSVGCLVRTYVRTWPSGFVPGPPPRSCARVGPPRVEYEACRRDECLPLARAVRTRLGRRGGRRRDCRDAWNPIAPASQLPYYECGSAAGADRASADASSSSARSSAPPTSVRSLSSISGLAQETHARACLGSQRRWCRPGQSGPGSILANLGKQRTRPRGIHDAAPLLIETNGLFEAPGRVLESPGQSEDLRQIHERLCVDGEEVARFYERDRLASQRLRLRLSSPR